eukprot:Gb_00624 [translate_table: standard]
MGANISTRVDITDEEDDSKLLKIVLPGCTIEVYDRPVKAAAVMSRYPKHCLTRPDVFQSPWVVVSPEAILMPGMKVFLVPNNTIRYLLKKPGRRFPSRSINPDSFSEISTFSHDDMPSVHKSSQLTVADILDKSSTHSVLKAPEARPNMPKRVYHSSVCKESIAAKLGFKCCLYPTTLESQAASNSRSKVASLQVLHAQMASHPRAYPSKMRTSQEFSGVHKIPVSKPKPDAAPPKRNRKVSFRSPSEEDIHYIPEYVSPQRSGSSSPVDVTRSFVSIQCHEFHQLNVVMWPEQLGNGRVPGLIASLKFQEISGVHVSDRFNIYSLVSL